MATKLENLTRDAKFLSTVVRVARAVGAVKPDARTTLADDIERTVDRHRDNVLFRLEDGVVTYGEFEARANRFANLALEEGLKAGDCIAIFLENCTDFVAAWYGFSKLGVVAALINTNLEREGLAHSINIVGAQYVLTDKDGETRLAAAKPHLTDVVNVWTKGGAFEARLAQASAERPAASHRQSLSGEALAMYIYTSGTTGLPKAAKISQARARALMRPFVTICKPTARDRIYLTLPLYHATGGIMGVGLALLTGASIILRKKFSASRFWGDVTDNGATIFIYIGELCRYLVKQPESAVETQHKLRAAIGNGLRGDIWEAFEARFKIPHLFEFYASTEGNATLCNLDSTRGACGRLPDWLKPLYNDVALVQVQGADNEPVRGDDGFCIVPDVNQSGELLGRIGKRARQRFEGYTDDEASQKKILRSVFEEGDAWFRSGDLMRKDADGYIYFIDRMGDTFRWKGENVSTSEVSQVVASTQGIETANVYGVEIPGEDGRAGMAAITTHGAVDYDTLCEAFSQRLPAYAVPVFLRVQKEASLTTTFKYRKVDLVAEGFDPYNVSDPIWMLHPEMKTYVPLTEDRYVSLKSGAFRF